MRWTLHAKVRAMERFPGVDLDCMYHLARPIGRNKRYKRIKKQCPASAAKWMDKPFKSRYILMTRCGIIFVMKAPETIITVFKLEEDK